MPPPPPARDQVAGYDLDGVVTRRDSFTALLVDRLRASPPRLIRAFPSLLRLTLHPGDAQRRSRAARRVTEVALSGLSTPEYQRLADEVGARIGGDPTWLRAEVVDRIRREHGAGTRVVVATASEHRLATALLRAADIPFDLLSASRLTGGPTGQRVADHRVGARKAEALRECGVPLDEAVFTTDSYTDLPAARLAARVVLVGATRRTRERYAAAGIDVRAR
ncbi:HAD family hydrolase [Actinoalloteichus sp. AHMU CJ021]|uniref:HAD family hydrolase n=1 Tax=Actinoalloteichus sp. AHMU CJ021 TaxID=2072503 RepID=UPI0026C6AF56